MVRSKRRSGTISVESTTKRGYSARSLRLTSSRRRGPRRWISPRVRLCIEPCANRTKAHSIISERRLMKSFTAEIAETDHRDRGENRPALGLHHGVGWLTGRRAYEYYHPSPSRRCGTFLSGGS